MKKIKMSITSLGLVLMVTVLLSSNVNAQVTVPNDGATGQPTWRTINFNCMGGLGNYTLELNEQANFLGASKTFPGSSNCNIDVCGLDYSTKYYTRVKRGSGSWSTATDFTTKADPRAVVTYPSTGTTNYSRSYRIWGNYPDHDVEEILFEFSANTSFTNIIATSKIIPSLCPTANVDRKSHKLEDIGNVPNTTGGVDCNATMYVRVTHTTSSSTGSRTTTSNYITISTEGCSSRPGNNNGYESFDVINSYNVLPNPSTNNFNVRVDSDLEEKLTIRVTDLTGKVVYESFDELTNQNIKVGEKLEHGMYLMQLSHGDKSELIKIVKK